MFMAVFVVALLLSGVVYRLIERVMVLVAGGISVVTVPFAAPGELILFSAVVGFAGTVTFTICLLIWNHLVMPKHLPAPLRPGRWSWTGISLGAVACTLLAVGYVYVRFMSG